MAQAAWPAWAVIFGGDDLKHFAVLNNWHKEQPRTRFEAALEKSGLPYRIYQTNAGEFPDPSDVMGVFVGASVAGAYDAEPWIAREHDVLKTLADAGVPMLGLCFGSQILASALVGRDQVFKRVTRETGFDEIQLSAEGRCDPLTKDLPPKLRTFMWHGDEVRADHPDIVILADGTDCANHIWRWRQGQVWGIQPHPEMDQDQICRFIEKNRDWFEREGKDADALLRSPEPNDQLHVVFDRFFELVRQQDSL